MTLSYLVSVLYITLYITIMAAISIAVHINYKGGKASEEELAKRYPKLSSAFDPFRTSSRLAQLYYA